MVGIESAAVLRKDDNGKLHIKETADMGSGKGAAIGGALGAAVGLIAGTALVAPVVVGGLIGGLAAKLRDSGFNNDRLERLGEQLPAGSSMIIALVEHTWVDQVRDELAEQAADIVVDGLAEDVAQQLDAHHDVTYGALRTEGSVTVGREITDDGEGVEGAVVTADEQGVAGGAYVATDDGVVVAAAAADEEKGATSSG
ncbi:MAG: DUF1269 domain-containing protein [Acidimicrobiales bacterium]